MTAIYVQIFDCLRQLEARDFVEKTLASLQITCHAKVSCERSPMCRVMCCAVYVWWCSGDSILSQLPD
jgi:hypothetical protein